MGQKIIDLAARRKEKQGEASQKPQLGMEKVVSPRISGEIVDMSQRREATMERERRSVKRTILSEFVGVHVIVPGKGLTPCVLEDISERGLAFDLPVSEGCFKCGEQLALRLYLNQSTYFPFIVEVSNNRLIDSLGVFRHGANFVQDTVNGEALQHFVKFIESVSAHLKTDTGDVVVSGLR